MQYYCIAFLISLLGKMKVFSYIMALYMMVLFIMPCDDMYVSDRLQHNTTEMNVQDIHNHNEKADLCTPFCLCGCCGFVSAVVLQLNIFDFQTIKTFHLSKQTTHYKSVFIPRYFGEIWKPPKIIA